MDEYLQGFFDRLFGPEGLVVLGFFAGLALIALIAGLFTGR